MSEARSYAKPTEIGDVITSQSIGEVVESNDRRFGPGDRVLGQLGWQEYAVARSGSLRKVLAGLEPPTLALHAVGATGMTAYFGLFDVGKPRPGDTVVVSCAAGAVGQIAGQLARIAGCRTVGIAGGPEKTRELMELYGYDAAVDYKNADLGEELRRRRDLAGRAPAAQHRRTDRDLRTDLSVQRSASAAELSSRAADRLPRPDGGVSHLRLRTPVRRGRNATRALGRDRRAEVA
jgi:threonine dehydrogenase-like Zn-dependent dehydrogenase